MPWLPKDALLHTKKANTPTKKRQWAHISTGMLKSGHSEASAIRAAYSVIAKRGDGKPKRGLRRMFK